MNEFFYKYQNCLYIYSYGAVFTKEFVVSASGQIWFTNPNNGYVTFIA